MAEIVSNVEHLQQQLYVEESQLSFSQISTNFLSLLAAPVQLLLKEKSEKARIEFQYCQENEQRMMKGEIQKIKTPTGPSFTVISSFSMSS